MLGLASRIAVRVKLLMASPSLPTLPFDLIQEILCRLPVKKLLQLQCVCKSWNSLISDPKFANKHLRMSTTTPRLHRVRADYILTIYPLHSVFTTDVTQFIFPSNNFDQPYIIGSCNGILCISDFTNTSVLLWNPSINKFNELPLFQNPKLMISEINLTYGFGYDSFTVVAILQCIQVKVHTLGTNFWKTISEFPFGVKPVERSGKFVSDSINWLTFTDLSRQSPCFIVSFDLRKESFQKILPPHYGGVDVFNFTLSVVRDCLCIISGHDIWIMKEYGIQESWTKLFTVPNMLDPNNSYMPTKAVYIFEDDQVLLKCVDLGWNWNSVVYDSKNGLRYPL